MWFVDVLLPLVLALVRTVRALLLLLPADADDCDDVDDCRWFVVGCG